MRRTKRSRPYKSFCRRFDLDPVGIPVFAGWLFFARCIQRKKELSLGGEGTPMKGFLLPGTLNMSTYI